MTLIPTSYSKIETFKKYFDIYEKQHQEYLNKGITEINSNEFYESLKDIVSAYIKLLRCELKTYNIYKFLPVQTLQNAKKLNLIEDAETWISFIKALNVYSKASQTDRDSIRNEIISYYHDKVGSMLKHAYNEDFLELYEKYKNTKPDIAGITKYLSTELISNISEIGLTEKSSNTLIEFFKSNNFIKNVWVYGSRAYGNYTKGSDIDMIVDCPGDKYLNLKNNLLNLVIPYYIDCKCLNLEEHLEFISTVAPRGNKKIYSICPPRSIYWNESVPKTELKINLHDLIN